MADQRKKCFEGPRAVQELLRQMKLPISERPKIRILTESAYGELCTFMNLTLRNHVLMNVDAPGCHSIFHVADLFKSKSGQPIPPRFAWPHGSISPEAINLYPLMAVEIC